MQNGLTVLIACRHDNLENKLLRSNRIHELKNCLKSIFDSIEYYKSENKNSYESISVLLIDDNSRIQLKEYIKEFKDLSIIINKGTKGQGGALNYGLSKTLTKYVAFTDSDCIVDIYWIKTILNNLFMHGNALGVVGPNWNHINGKTMWTKYLTTNETKLMKYNFTKYINNETSTRIDLRNLSFNLPILYNCISQCPIPENTYSVSNELSYQIRFHSKVNNIPNLIFDDKMIVHHESIKSLRSQMLNYYKRARYGSYNDLYRIKNNSIIKSFFLRYLSDHFIKPVFLNGSNFFYVLLLHGAYWVGIVINNLKNNDY